MREHPLTGEMKYHKGVDYAIREEAPIVLQGGLQLDKEVLLELVGLDMMKEIIRGMEMLL